MKRTISSRKYSIMPVADNLLEKVSLAAASKSINDSKITALAVSTESYNAENETIITNAYNNFEATLKSIASELNVSLEDYQLEAASIAAIYGADPKKTLSTSLQTSANSGDILQNVRFQIEGATYDKPYSLEAYDERENRSAQVYSIFYNMLASKQDEFSETFFPTIVVNTVDVGITLDVRIFQVFNDFKRSVNGSLANKRPVNLVRAYADPTILKHDGTKAVPVYRATGGPDDSTANFVPSTVITPWNEVVGDVTVQTSALLVGRKVDLIGLSQTNELLANGVMDSTDNLDTYARLDKIYVRFTDPGNPANVDVYEISTENLPGSTFNYAVQGNARKMVLALETTSIVFDNTVKRVDGSAPVVLTELAANNWDVRFNLNITGDIRLDEGSTIVNRGSIGLEVIRDNSGNLVTPTTVFNDKVNTADIIGYTLTAYRANSNLRDRGQLLETQRFFQVVNIPYNSPLTTLKPTIEDGSADSTALQTLVNATGVRTSQSAVRALQRIEASMATFVAIADNQGELPETAGIGRYYVRPTYFTATLDLAQTVDSLVSHERIKDIRAAIVEKIRYYATEMYRKSEYQAAAAVLTGNIGMKPTVIVGCDPTVYNYIMADGDIRTLGELFDLKVVKSLNRDILNKIYITFGVFDSNRNTAVNPLNFGNMLWSPELTVTMPISRNGQISKELIVAPRFLHMVNLPVLTVLNVTNLPSVTGKVAVNMHSV